MYGYVKIYIKCIEMYRNPYSVFYKKHDFDQCCSSLSKGKPTHIW